MSKSRHWRNVFNGYRLFIFYQFGNDLKGNFICKSYIFVELEFHIFLTQKMIFFKGIKNLGSSIYNLSMHNSLFDIIMMC